MAGMAADSLEPRPNQPTHTPKIQDSIHVIRWLCLPLTLCLLVGPIQAEESTATPASLPPAVLKSVPGLAALQSDLPHLDLLADWSAEKEHWQRAFRPKDGLQDFQRELIILKTDRDIVDTMVRRVRALWEDLRPRLDWDADRIRATSAMLDELAQAVQTVPPGDNPDRLRLWLSLCVQRLRIALANPLLDFDRLLINEAFPPAYNHSCDQYLGRHSFVGPGLVVLGNWRGGPIERRELLRELLPAGATHNPALSYDGHRVAFGFCDHSANQNERVFWLYEIGVDGQGLRRLTGGSNDRLETVDNRATVRIEDWDPCYLPDGGLAFVSTRNQAFGRCHGERYTPSYTLYRMDGDANSIRPLSHGEANEWNPAVLADGRIVFCRWDYINRHDTVYHSLWTIRPDGTSVAHYYGNQSRNIAMITQAQPIPGDDSRVVALGTAHHGWSAGSVFILDTHHGEDGVKPVTRVIFDISFPQTSDGAWDWRGAPAAANTPWPLSCHYHLCSLTYADPRNDRRNHDKAAGWGIYLIDVFGNRVLLYRSPSVGAFSPIPLRPRPVPPALPSTLPVKSEDPGFGTFILSDVRRSRQTFPDEPIVALRLNRIHVQPLNRVHSRGAVENEVVKGVIGTVLVAADGSAAFRAPSGMPLQIQALDARGRAVMTQRSFTFLQPGEVQSCVGCHEPRETAPSSPLIRLQTTTIATPTPPAYGGDGQPFDFDRLVKPVIDRHCLRCHGLGKTEKGVNLTDPYNVLIPYLKLAVRNKESVPSRPDDYFTRAGKLLPILDAHSSAGPLSAGRGRGGPFHRLDGSQRSAQRLPETSAGGAAPV